jgi:hypothetical protein
MYIGFLSLRQWISTGVPRCTYDIGRGYGYREFPVSAV